MYRDVNLGRHKIHARALGRASRPKSLKRQVSWNYPHRHLDTARVLAADGDVEEDDRESHGVCC